MADNEGFNGDPLAEGSYSELLFADDIVGLENRDGIVGASSVSNGKTPKMLCFGDYQNEYDLVLPQIATQKSGATCTESSSKSSANNGKTRKKRNGCVDEPGRSLRAGAGTPAGRQRSVKKIKSEKSAGNGHAKVRKETLGERISALQKLVSPFGKTDTASVLHEATGYIKFLHDQVKVLCSPYLQPLGTSIQAQLQEGGETGEDRSGKDLRSRGLCLVPVDSTLLVANSNGADFWSPAAAMGNNVLSDRH